MQRPQPVSVGRLLNLLKQSVSRAFGTVLVTGEVIDPLVSPRGHLYFRLSDGQAEMKVVMWRNDLQRCHAQLVSGDQITVRGSLDVYAPRGDLQLVASALVQSGKGQKLLAISQLRAKLKGEGLFERERRPIPRHPQRVGIVTSIGSAVIHDIYQSVQKRYPSCQLILSPSSVSGEMASKEIIVALNRLKERAEVVIIARGGGSFEELLPFSDEALVRFVANYPIPVISAVGHGSDQTLLDLVADHTAPTPTAAAVLVTPDRQELQILVATLRTRALRQIERLLKNRKDQLTLTQNLCRLLHPCRQIQQQRKLLNSLRFRLKQAMLRRVGQCQEQLQFHSQRICPQKIQAFKNRDHQRLLSAVDRLKWTAQRRLKAQIDQFERWQSRLQVSDPKRRLAQGYVMVTSGQKLVTSTQGRSPGQELELHFADGLVIARIERVEPR